MDDDDYAKFLKTWKGLLATADVSTGRFKHLSSSWSLLLGWSREELLAKPFLEFVHPEDRAATIAATQSQVEGHDIARFSNRYACKDGSYKWLLWTSSPPSEDGLVHATAHDITEHVETRQQLERTLLEVQSFRNLMDATSDFVGVASHEAKVMFVNQAGLEMLGRSDDQVVGQSLETFYTATDYARLREALPIVSEQGTWTGEATLVRADGSKLPISQVIVRLSESDNGFGMIIRDISRAKELEADLRAQSERLMQALQAMSTPFIPITNDIVVMPLIGQMDSKRAEQVMEVALGGVSSSGARVVILDLTGLTTVDSMVAASLVQTARSLRLLGTETILTGIQPAVAQTLVGLGLDFTGATTHATLQSAIEVALRGAGARRRP